MADFSALDANLVLRNVHDATNEALKISIVSGSTTQLDKVDSPTFTLYSSINGSGGAWAELKANSAALIKQLQIYDTTGLFFSIAVGGLGSEVVECIMGPGVDGLINVNIPAGSRISIRGTETTTFAAGAIAINYLG